MMKNFKIFVVMPAYNEAAHIADVIHNIPQCIDKIIVVDDNSSDGTPKVARSTGDARVTIIENTENLGVGGATIQGYRYALENNADVIVKVDADGQMDPKMVPRLIKPIVEGNADYSKGFRFHDKETIRKMPNVRLIGNLGLSFLVKMASGYWNIFDPTNGFTAIHKGALEKVDLAVLSSDYFFETSMLCALYRIQAVVKDVPLVGHYGQEVSELEPAKALKMFPGKLLWAFIIRIVWNYYIRDFSTFSILFFVGWLLMLFGFGFGGVQWWQHATQGIATPTGTVMISVVPLFVGFQMALQALLIDINSVPKDPLQNY